MLPQLPDLALSSNIPDGEAHVLDRMHCLHVEPNGRDGGYGLVQLQLVEQCRLSSAVQPEQQNLRVLSAGKGLVKTLEFSQQ